VKRPAWPSQRDQASSPNTGPAKWYQTAAGSGDKQAKAKLCRLEIEEVAVAFGPPTSCKVITLAAHWAHGVTTLTVKLAFSDAAGRPTRFEGMQESFDRIDDVVRSLLDPSGTVSG
jgi:hypothetical protein